jgi:hypothetical protein
MVGPLGVVPVSPAAATTEVEEDVDDDPPGGAGVVLYRGMQWSLQKKDVGGNK